MIIARSFADIFYNNCFKYGILPISLTESIVKKLLKNIGSYNRYKLFIDLPNKRIKDSYGFQDGFEIDDYRCRMLMEGMDEIEATLEYTSKIDAFEDRHQIYYQLK
ncbi:3-isopropylmalate dehydratase small subunit 2 [Pseudalkalibacillus sp. A8]|uniref:3-isopropylmalate dehydratase small subunit n=1 Tax=Pseudalkalibacillus sp. A8 TaxID=3382641 RepID=UPI0038B630CE